MSSILTVIVAVCFLIPSSGLAQDTAMEDDQRYDVIDPYLETMMREWGPGEMVELIVQFDSPVMDSDRTFLSRLGLSTIQEFHVIPAIAVRGPASVIPVIEQYERTLWVEWNEPLVHMMDTTTSTINATEVWRKEVIDTFGIPRGFIDGTGITVVDLDSGVDAGHPDLDYHEKVILNLKSDTGGIYTEAVNTDTSSGHGTHVAGTIAGNGDASAMARRGVAPGARLIGISTGEAVAIINALGAMEWTYDHSRPGFNPYNIRIVSNSWGSSAEYNPQDAINQVTRKLTFDNNVVVVFAAGNEGSSNHDGSTVTTNPYSLEPSSISVAAIEKDGNGVAVFSSRGIAKDNFTWPDVGAPGVNIWATQARKTLITAMYSREDPDRSDGYYMAISGTSMATPHISGVVALLWQAAPSMRVSEVHDDHQGIRPKDPQYWANPTTRIHESELILKLTADFINVSDGNGVPKANWTGINDQRYDFAQGYGNVNVENAVALALTLEALRSQDPQATVWDALQVYMDAHAKGNRTHATDIIATEWSGDWSELNSASTPIVAKHPRYIYVPENAVEMSIDFAYSALDANDHEMVNLYYQIDVNGDGSPEHVGDRSFDATGNKKEVIDLRSTLSQARGKTVIFLVDGDSIQGPGSMRPYGGANGLGENEYNEVISEYKMGVSFRLDLSSTDYTLPLLPPEAAHGQLIPRAPSQQYSGGNITVPLSFFQMGQAMDSYLGLDAGDGDGFPTLWEAIREFWSYVIVAIIIIALLALMVGEYVGMKMRVRQERTLADAE